MNKLWLIIQREYLSRVRKKTFILTTILTPIGFVLFFVVIMFIMTSGAEEKQFALVDEQDLLQTQQGRSLRDNSTVHFKPVRLSLDSAKSQLAQLECNGIIYIPQQDTQLLRNVRVEYYSDEQLGVNTLEFVEKVIEDRVREVKVKRSGIDPALLESFKTSVELTPKSITPKPADESEASRYRVYVATFLGGIMMFLIYIVVFIYGNMVMRSVMEEKTSRIVEVIMSSVKPFQLMLGKIIGVGAVGLTQFAIWAIVFPLMYMGVGLLFAGRLQNIEPAAMGAGANMEQPNAAEMMLLVNEIVSFDYGRIIFFFLIFFILGYLLYASLFAAVGSAMNDDWGEGQSLTMIIVIPVAMGFYIGTAAIQNPNGTLAMWSSIFPLFSPIVMPARAVFDPPMWQMALSIALLLVTSLFFVWLSGRIYRVGILMYGKKTSIKEFVKWIFYKE